MSTQPAAAAAGGPAPSVWDAAKRAAAGGPPDDAHEFNARKQLRDAAFLSLDHAPFCPHAPVCAGGCGAPRWAWRPKAGGGAR